MRIFKIEIEFLILILSFILLSILAIFSNGYYEGADNISHYNISHFAFQHPRLFLDNWGKPFFTLLSSPFSQFGFKGIVFFNIICGILTSFFAFQIVKELKYTYSYLACVFVTFSQYYFMMHLTALTEILFGLMLVISIFLALKNKYILSAILLSFLPFVRNEGFMVFPFFFFYFISNKQYQKVTFMLTGFITYSIIGYFYYNDFLWVIHLNPYMNSTYGNGSYFHFLNKLNVVSGIPLLILAICGFLLLVYHSVNTKKKEIFSEQLKAEWLLIVLPFMAYFFFHSYLWGKGIGGSLGLLRVMVGVAPLASIISLKGFNFFIAYVKKINLKFIFIIIVSSIIIYMPFREYKFPVKVDSVGLLINNSAKWVNENNTNKERIYYYDPSFHFEFGADPFLTNTDRDYFQLYSSPFNDIKINSILIWDAHFGGSDCKVPKNNLMESKEFKLLKIFQPAEEIIIMDHKYEIYIFNKIAFDEKNDNYEIENLLRNNM